MEFKLFIDGEWVSGGGIDETLVSNPADETPVGYLRHASHADIDAALKAAADALRGWRNVRPQERSEIMHRAADLIDERVGDLAVILTTEQGKPLAESAGELHRSAATIRWFAKEGVRIEPRVEPGEVAGSQRIIDAEPVGVVAALTAWNFPAVLPARKLAPALAAGCTVILKAAEETPGTAIGLVKAFEDAGLPKGVLNLLYGRPAEISEHLLSSPIIRKLSFTGSVAVGKLLAALASQHLIRSTLELGGHAPMIVFPDADIDHSVAAASSFKWRNAGQVCLAPSRFYIHESVYAEFIDKFANEAQAVNVGPGLDAETEMGPLNNRRRLNAVDELVRDAIDRGATLLTGGKRLGNKGFFFEPTVLSDTPEDAALMNVEPFGPVAPFASFDEIDEVINRSNRLAYGLASYVFTGSEETARLMSKALEAGTVGINGFTPAPTDAPLGGVKDSGYGYEGGREGLEAYLHLKLVNKTGLLE